MLPWRLPKNIHFAHPRRFPCTGAELHLGSPGMRCWISGTAGPVKRLSKPSFHGGLDPIENDVWARGIQNQDSVAEHYTNATRFKTRKVACHPHPRRTNLTDDPKSSIFHDPVTCFYGFIYVIVF